MSMSVKVSGSFPDPDAIIEQLMEEGAKRMRRVYCNEHQQSQEAKVVRKGQRLVGGGRVLLRSGAGARA
jgi:hypothetical protein